MFDFEKQLKNLPEKPGVYLMHDKNDKIIYIGKAKVLKNRVRQYFGSQKNHGAKVRAMVSHVAWFEYIITDSELEALMLECKLIKQYHPHYNILLKDDKHYPYIKVTVNEPYPQIIVTRTMSDDKARYFGPYSGMGTVKNTLDLIRRIFKIPTCKKQFPRDIGKARPCLNYQIKRCFAPCKGDVSHEEYRKVFLDICKFLEGDHRELTQTLIGEMNEASERMEYEKAADIRDKIASLKALEQKQKIISDKMKNQDIAAFKCYNNMAFAELFFVRGGALVGHQSHIIDGIESFSDEYIMSEFLKRYYESAAFVPEEIISSCSIEDEELFCNWLSERLGKKLVFTVPQRGEKKKLVKMLEANANNSIEKYKLEELKKLSKQNLLQKLADYIGLENPPMRIESYDISNTAGDNNVGAMVVFENTSAAFDKFRRFRIKSVIGQDDYASMSEVITRRIKRAREELNLIQSGELEEDKAKFLPLPDLILLDGGKGHVLTVKKVLSELDCPLNLFGMVKDDKHRFRALTDGEKEYNIPKNSSVYTFIGKVSEQVHKTAIEYHRTSRSRATFVSELSQIRGIGDKRQKLLLKSFKSIDAVANASAEALVNAGLDKKSAENVYNYFNE